MGKVLEIDSLQDRDYLAEQIADKYASSKSRMQTKLNEWGELRNYLFATSTQDTTNDALPWSNTTTTPKLTQIRDNLHANYMDAVFPNDNWLKWEGHSAEAEVASKRKAIQTYMFNKTNTGDFRNAVSKALYDYIDYGNCIGDVEFVREVHTDAATGEEVVGYVGPKAVRVSPLDLVIDPTATSFRDSYKITRHIKTFGQLRAEAMDKPEQQYLEEAFKVAEARRIEFSHFDPTDTIKNEAYTVDGFGSLVDYYQSPYVEILEFVGDIHEKDGQLIRNQLITIIDRSIMIRKIDNPNWLGRSSLEHAGWRPRPDNLWAMGPLDNLVGMQYRLDHLENVQADLMDLAALPPVKVRGNVEEFEWGPLEKIYLGDDGDIDLMRVESAAFQYDAKIDVLMRRMEEMAGAPKEAMGIRTPGEKTAFEVQSLQNAAGRLFNNRIRNFEINWLEPMLNNMLEVARRNMDGADLVRVMDDDIGVVEFTKITKEDITAEGKLRPVGSRHFAAEAQLVQNLNGVFNSQIGAMIAPHVSPKKMAALVEDLFGLNKFDLVSDNAAVMEQMETQRLMQQGSEQLEVEAMTPGTEGEDEDLGPVQ